MKIDLRSDTVTIPTKEMEQFMMNSKIGDDVLDDPSSVTELEQYASNLFKMESALFCPSGTMTNQIGGLIGSTPMSSIILDESSHMYIYEVGGLAFHSRAQPLPLKGDQGRITAKQIEENIIDGGLHVCKTSMVAVENTTNRGGGATYNFSELEKISTLCKQKKIHFHLDGARLFHAIVKNNEDPKKYGAIFDSISICLSKGLGAPVGSLLLSSKENILKAKKYRKLLGGGMRQSSYLAAAGLYALQNNIARLEQDHTLAKNISNLLLELPIVKKILPAETNIIIFELNDKMTPENFVKILNEHQIYAFPFGKKSIRFVTHLSLPENTFKLLKERFHKIQDIIS